MKCGELHAACKLLSRISNQSSLTSLYKSIEISAEHIRCCSEFGNIKIKTNPFGIRNAWLLDTQAVLAVAATLPPDNELELSEGTSRIAWKCGEAKGHWNIVHSDHSIEEIEHSNFPWEPPAGFAEALKLGAAVCQAQAVSVGLYGLVIKPVENHLKFMSSNSLALAYVSIDKGSYPAGEITLRPPVPGIIADLVTACPGSKLDVTNEGIFIQGSWLIAKLPFGVPLQHDLSEIVRKFLTGDKIVKVDKAAIQKFITRARMLSDKHASFTIGLRIEDGKLCLSHAGITSSTEEFFLAEGLDPSINFATKPYLADMLLVALPHVESAMIDYLDSNELVLKGTNPEFIYVVGGGD